MRSAIQARSVRITTIRTMAIDSSTTIDDADDGDEEAEHDGPAGQQQRPRGAVTDGDDDLLDAVGGARRPVGRRQRVRHGGSLPAAVAHESGTSANGCAVESG